MTIDLTSPKKAISYLMSLPRNKQVELPGPCESTVAGDAVTEVTQRPANNWAIRQNQWFWYPHDLAAQLQKEKGQR